MKLYPNAPETQDDEEAIHTDLDLTISSDESDFWQDIYIMKLNKCTWAEDRQQTSHHHKQWKNFYPLGHRSFNQLLVNIV